MERTDVRCYKMARRSPFVMRVRSACLALILAGAISALAEVHYVDVNSTNATPPYTNWITAATNIQDAVNAAVAGDEIMVTNGIYHAVSVGNSIVVRSVNGPQATIIFGGGRCAYLTGRASLLGFTLTHGSASDGGAGVKCQSTNEVVSNCVITGNQVVGFLGGQIGDDVVRAYGGGAYGGTLNNCTLWSNSVSATWTASWAGQAVAQGGGAHSCTLNNCTLNGNSAYAGILGSTFSRSLAQGGGASSCTLKNCTLVNNSVNAAGGLAGNSWVEAEGGGTFGGTVDNCIAFLNTATVLPPFIGGWSLGEDFNTRDFDSSWEGDPLFVDYAGGDLRLQSNSPCINAGNNSYVTSATDLDGNPRIAGGTVDIGAYEFQSPASMISYAWLQQYGLPINAATDTADPDGDGVDNYHEWLAHSDPTNPFSFPPLLTLIPFGANVILTWPTNAVGFTLQSTTNLGSPANWSTNSPAPIVIGGQNVITNLITGAQQFYRLSQ